MTEMSTIIDMLREQARSQEESTRRIEDALTNHARDDADAFRRIESRIEEINAWRNRAIGVMLVVMSVLGVVAPAIGRSVGVG